MIIGAVITSPVSDTEEYQSHPSLGEIDKGQSSGAVSRIAPSHSTATPKARARIRPKSKKALNNKTFRGKTEQNRRDRVAAMEQEYDGFAIEYLSRHPSQLTQGDKYQVSLMRRKLQLFIEDLRRYQEPYIGELISRLTDMKASLYKHSDYVDSTSEAYKLDYRKRNRESVQRFRARHKVQKYGIDIKPRRAKDVMEEGEPVPPEIVSNRSKVARYRQRAKDKKENERERLFKKSWGKKKSRS